MTSQAALRARGGAAGTRCPSPSASSTSFWLADPSLTRHRESFRVTCKGSKGRVGVAETSWHDAATASCSNDLPARAGGRTSSRVHHRDRRRKHPRVRPRPSAAAATLLDLPDPLAVPIELHSSEAFRPRRPKGRACVHSHVRARRGRSARRAPPDAHRRWASHSSRGGGADSGLFTRWRSRRRVAIDAKLAVPVRGTFIFEEE